MFDLKAIQRDTFRYTALFCEENVWWLARSLVDAGVDPARLQVLLFSNRWRSIVLFNQRQARPGQALAWDYHVVLRAELDGGAWVFDPDTRLPFPVACEAYLAQTFAEQSALPERYRTQVRVIPAASYLAHFYSDRAHMIGQIPADAFPDYPIIQPALGVQPIALSDYWDMHKALQDGSVVMPVEALRTHPVTDTPAGARDLP